MLQHVYNRHMYIVYYRRIITILTRVGRVFYENRNEPKWVFFFFVIFPLWESHALTHDLPEPATDTKVPKYMHIAYVKI